MIETFTATIDYGPKAKRRTIREMIGKMFRRDQIHHQITRIELPVSSDEEDGVITVEMALIDLNRPVEWEEAARAIETLDPENPWELARSEHVIAASEYLEQLQGFRKRRAIILGLGARIKTMGCWYALAVKRAKRFDRFLFLRTLRAKLGLAEPVLFLAFRKPRRI